MAVIGITVVSTIETAVSHVRRISNPFWQITFLCGQKANSLYLEIAVLSAIRNHIAINTPLYREATGNSYFKCVYTNMSSAEIVPCTTKSQSACDKLI